MARMMARPSLAIHCPKSSLSWRAGTRARAGRPGELTATCPSCGQGLVAVTRGGQLALVRPGNATGPGHELIRSTSTSGGLRT